MTRLTLSLVVVAGLSVWAPAQAPTPADQLAQFRTNRGLLEDLLGHGVRLSRTTTSLDRAEKCRDAVGTLRLAMQSAAEDPHADPERVAELGDCLATVVRDGLAPALAKARQDVPRGSREYDRMKKLHVEARAELIRLEQSLPTDGRVGRSGSVKDARQKLTAAVDQIVVPE